MSEVLPRSAIAALMAVAKSHGLTIDPESVQSTAGEAPLSQIALVGTARAIGFKASAKILNWRKLAKFRRLFPALLTLKDGSALLLESVAKTPSGEIALVRDPLIHGETRIPIDEARLTEIWTGSILLLEPQFPLEDERRKFNLRWLIDQLRREKKIMRDLVLASFMLTFTALVPPFVTLIVMDRVFLSRSIPTLVALTGILVVAAIVEMVLGNLKRRFTAVLTSRIDARINLFIMERVLRLPMEFFERVPTGEITGRIFQSIRIRDFITGQLFGTLLEMISLVVFLPLMFVLDWRLTLFVIAIAICIFGVVAAYIGPVGIHVGRVVKASIDRGIYLVETLRGIRAVKSLALEGTRRKEWDRRIARLTIEQYDLGKISTRAKISAIPFERMTYSGTFLLGTFLALRQPDSLLPGTLLAFTMIAARTTGPLLHIARLLESVTEIRSAISEVGRVVNTTLEDTRSETGLREPIRGHVIFKDVRFRYAPDAPPALKDASFEIQPGTIFGIMGRSGSGKTTITRLLQGLNPIYDGSIKIDGMDLRQIDLMHLRRSIGVVPQENYLFTGTIRENIGIARPDASFAEIVRAAQLAGAEEFIERLTRGYDTMLEEGATNLSGGQRQRLAIARALIVDPAILILDEATSALDAESEAIINANLIRIARDRTIICVSHRLSMLVPADAILVMEQGKPYDIGTHEELLRRCDIYKHMWYTQNRYTETEETAHSPLALAHTATR